MIRNALIALFEMLVFAAFLAVGVGTVVFFAAAMGSL